MQIKLLPPPQTPETQKVLKKAISANRALAKLNGTAKMIPNQNILINALVLQEANSICLMGWSRLRWGQ